MSKTSYLREIMRLQHEMRDLENRIRREPVLEGHQCYCTRDHSDDPDLLRLQGNLADIRRELGIVGTNQASTMIRLKSMIRVKKGYKETFNKIQSLIRGY